MEAVRGMDRGSWSVTKKEEKVERAAGRMLSSHFVPRADTGVFRDDFTGAAVIQRASSGEQGSCSTHF